MSDIKNGMRRGAILALSLVALMMTSGLAIAQNAPVDGAPDTRPGEDIDYTRENIVIEQDLENGEILLKLGEARMLVNYGDGRIQFATIQTKYMGIADVYDDHRGFDKRVGIPVETIFWQRLIGVVEYADQNDNGIFDVHGPKVAGTLDELSDSLVSHEPMVKWVDYDNVEWTLTQWHQQQNGNEVDITFVLGATDIPYDTNHGQITNKRVERLAYIFHVTTVEEEIVVEAVPHYRIMADENGSPGDQIDDSRLLAHTNVTGHVLNSTWKYDQLIQGWDVAIVDGAERNDTRLVVLTEMAYGVHMSDAVGEWIREEFGGLPAPRAIAGHAPRQSTPDIAPDVVDAAEADSPEHDARGNPLRCGLAYVTGSGPVHPDSDGTEGRSTNGRATGDNTDQSDEERQQDKVKERIREYTETACMQRGAEMVTDSEAQSEAIRAGTLHFKDNGADLGRVRWVSNATVDGLETEVLFQKHGARPILPEDVGQQDGIWAGVRMVGGYNYVLGNSVYHDPEFSSDIMTMDTQSFGEPVILGGSLVQMLSGLVRMLPLLIGVVVVGAIAVGVARSRRDTAPLPQQHQYAPAGAWTSGDDWDQYDREV